MSARHGVTSRNIQPGPSVRTMPQQAAVVKKAAREKFESAWLRNPVMAGTLPERAAKKKLFGAGE